MYTPTPEEWALIGRALGEFSFQSRKQAGELYGDFDALADEAAADAHAADVLAARLSAAGCTP